MLLEHLNPWVSKQYTNITISFILYCANNKYTLITPYVAEYKYPPYKDTSVTHLTFPVTFKYKPKVQLIS